MASKKKKRTSTIPKAKVKAKAKKKPAVSKKKPVVVTQPKRTYITFVIDRSGSMGSIRAETIEHVNEQIESIQAESKGQETHVSLVTFNDLVDCHFFNETLDKLKPLTLKTYKPSGYTAMLDAVGYSVNRMMEIPELEDENAAALVVVVSDGMENASKKWSRQMLAKVIRKLQNTKRWTFSYLGANQDLSIIEEIGIPKGNICAFVSDSQGMRSATTKSVESAGVYLSARMRGETQVSDYYVIKPDSK